MSTRSFAATVVEPLVCTARTLDWAQRTAYLNDLRADAPTLIAEVERRLSADAPVPQIGALRPGIVGILLQYLRRNAPRAPH
jgi:uncharacterized protein YfaQ (DUF2300 family)